MLHRVVTIISICCLLFLPVIYIHRPIIPFYFIGPYMSWRTYECDRLYHRNIIQRDNFVNNLKLQLTNKPYIFLQNDYPYNVDAKHYILWMSDTASHNDIHFFINKLTESKCMVKYFENPIYRRSVPSITHYHVFLKCKE